MSSNPVGDYTYAGLVQFQNVAGIEIGKDAASGTGNTAGVLKFWSAEDNAFYTQFTAAEQSETCEYTLPTAKATSNDFPLIGSTAGVLSWNDQALKTSSSPTFAGLTLGQGTVTGRLDCTAQTDTGDFRVISLSENTCGGYKTGFYFTDDSGIVFFNIAGSAATSTIFGGGVAGDDHRRIRITTGQGIKLGPGSAAEDTSAMARISTGLVAFGNISSSDPGTRGGIRLTASTAYNSAFGSSEIQTERTNADNNGDGTMWLRTAAGGAMGDRWSIDHLGHLLAAGASNITTTGTITGLLTPPAGTTAAGTAPIKFTTGTSLTAPEAGATEFTTDDLFFTITTGTARKRLLMAEPVGGLTATRVPYVTTNGRLTDSASLTTDGSGLTTAKVKLTPEGGVAVLLTNKAGANTEKGRIVEIYVATAVDNAVTWPAAASAICMGVMYETGVADGEETWIVVNGIAEVLFANNEATVRGNWVAQDAVGYATSAYGTSPPAATAHFNEIGHCLESNAAPGAGNHVLAKVAIHFN